MLEPMIDFKEPVTGLEFGPYSPGNLSLKVKQKNKTTVLYFSTSIELLDFCQYFWPEKFQRSASASPTGGSPNKPQISAENPPSLQGWSESFAKGEAMSKKSIEDYARTAKTNFFFIEHDNDEASLEDHTKRWKRGIKWYNESLQVFRALTPDQLLINHFVQCFKDVFAAFAVRTWNEHYQLFNLLECGIFFAFLRNVVKHTDIARPTSGGAGFDIQDIFKSIKLNIHSIFLKNIAPVIHKILINFWHKDNFEFDGTRIMSKAVLDISYPISELKHKLSIDASLDNETSLEVLLPACNRYSS